MPREGSGTANFVADGIEPEASKPSRLLKQGDLLRLSNTSGDLKMTDKECLLLGCYVVWLL
jgi:hypothetical protein